MHPILTDFEQAAAATPARVAVSDPTLTLEYAAFRAIAAGLAERIEAASAKPAIGILAPTSAAGAAAIFACWFARRTPVPLNFLLPPEALARIARDADLDLIVTIAHFEALARATGLPVLMLDSKSLVPGRRAAPPAGEADLGAMIYTSGTSGDPKGVRLTFRNLVQNARACAAHAQITGDEVMLSVLPQFHSFGFTAMTVLPLLIGAQVHYLPRFSPASIINTIEEKRATIFMAVASMYAGLLKMRDAAPSALRSLKLAISGGEPLSPAVAREFEARFGVVIDEGYGLTETSPVATINVPWGRKAGSVGRAIPGVEISAIDSAGRVVAPGQEGELLIRGHCVMQGYHNKPDQTAEVIRDGALRTGDIGRIDPDGFVFITGRAKEMIIVGGENVFPREIEAAMAQHPAVAEVAVIGAKDDLRGEVPIAFVILHEGATATEAELRSFCREHLAGFKVPRDVRISTDLPRGPTGKILKRALQP